jgi:signal transduction histidine kinase/ligand-binding sensor domain-containing protein
MRKTLLIYLICLAAGFGSEAFGQGSGAPFLNPRWALTQYVHSAWGAQEGLPQSSVYAITQTVDGHLWVGTQQRLVRFDGLAFQEFEDPSDPNLAVSWVRALLQDRNGALWMGTWRGGLVRYHLGKTTIYSTANGFPSDNIRSLFEDSSGYLWIGTEEGGLVRFDGNTFRQFAADEGLESNIVLSITEDENGQIWVGTNRGLGRMVGDRFEQLREADGLPSDVVFSVIPAAGGGLWVGTVAGIARYTVNGFEVPSAQCSGPITALYEDRVRTLWAGTRGGGVCRIRRDRVDHFSVRDGLTFDDVIALYEDREGNLWIGTDGGGLNMLRSAKFYGHSTAEQLSNASVSSILHARDGSIYVGTERGGLNRIVDNEVVPLSLDERLRRARIFALHEDRRGRILVGTEDYGLCIIDNGRTQCLTTRDGLSNDVILLVYEDRSGRLWIGTYDGLDILENGRIRNYSSYVVTSVYESPDGDLWFGTWDEGLIRLSAAGETRFGKEEGLASTSVLSVFGEGEVLYIGTVDGGFCRLSGGTIRCYSRDNGFPFNSVTSIIADLHGDLWIGTSNGIYRLTISDLDAFDAGSFSSVPVRLFEEMDGLRSREIVGGSFPTVVRDDWGRIWFATVRGTAVVEPIDYHVNPVPPPAVVQYLVVDGRRIPAENSDLVLEPGVRNLQFHYAGLSFVAPERVRFQYMLEGYDNEWVDAGTRREAYYTNLGPGAYVFRVRAQNIDGVWSESDAFIRVRLQPFFYQTSWFFAFSLILFGGAALGSGFGLMRLRERQLKLRAEALTQLVEEQTRELTDQKLELEKLNGNLEYEVHRQISLILEQRMRYEQELISAKDKAEESARLKSTILNNMSHEIRTPISAILGSSQILAEEVGDEHQEFVDFINQNGKRLLSTLNAILDLSRFEKNEMKLELQPIDLREVVAKSVEVLLPLARNRDLDLRTDLPSYPVLAETDNTALERILHNLIGNALKFTDSGEVVVAVEDRDGRACLSVRDTGIGIGEAFLPHVFEEFKQESTGLSRSHEGSGLGLAITRRLAEAMDGTVEVVSKKGVGSIFTVKFALVMQETLATQN